MLKAFRYRIYPNTEQADKLLQHIGSCRFIYNYSLETKIRAYERGERVPNYMELSRQLPKLKKQHTWLKSVNAQSLQSANMHLDTAFTRFFRKKSAFPKFKSKKDTNQSFSVPQGSKVLFEESLLWLPKIGWIKAVFHRRFDGAMRTVTVKLTTTKKYFVSILVDDGKSIPEPMQFSSQTTVGIDVGIASLITTSDGRKIRNPLYLQNSLSRLKHLQRSVTRKGKGSNNRTKAIKKLGLLYERIGNQRNDFLHKLTFNLVSENQAIAVETLDIALISKERKIARSVNDSSWGELFRQLEYKCKYYGKVFLTIGRFEPSSRLCSGCGYVNHNLKVSDRKWTCPECKIVHDRDINAAINIKKMAIQKQNIQGRDYPVSLLTCGRYIKG